MTVPRFKDSNYGEESTEDSVWRCVDDNNSQNFRLSSGFQTHTCLTAPSSDSQRKELCDPCEEYRIDLSQTVISALDTDVCASVGVAVAVLVDHTYATSTEKTVPIRLDTTKASVEMSDLSSLIENCDLDEDFIAGAVGDEESFQHFLEDVVNDCNVPADDILLRLLDDGHSEPRPAAIEVRTSSRSSTFTPLGQCLFSSAGSTETRLCASVSVSTPFTFTPIFKTGRSVASVFQTGRQEVSTFQSSTSFVLPATELKSPLSSPNVQASSFPTLEKHSCDRSDGTSWFKDSSCLPLSAADFHGMCDLTDAAAVPTSPLSSDDAPTEARVALATEVRVSREDNPTWQEYCSDCISVSLSHRITNGTCLLCSAAKETRGTVPLTTTDEINNNVISDSLSGEVATFEKLATSCSGKRKSTSTIEADFAQVPSEECPKRAKLHSDNESVFSADDLESFWNGNDVEDRALVESALDNSDTIVDLDKGIFSKMAGREILDFFALSSSNMPSDSLSLMMEARFM